LPAASIAAKSALATLVTSIGYIVTIMISFVPIVNDRISRTTFVAERMFMALNPLSRS